ncbi:hypothetical protein GY26_05525 [Gammaproteobacteria bacterium MFB021]|nr:hypothetical protein GY26_05525 [Gammaproteobacteria bacterium MFB021]
MPEDPILGRLVGLARQRNDLAALWLYGSRARESHQAGSDYDLAVVFIDWMEPALDRRLRPELLALDWQDVLGLSEAQLSVVDLAIAPIPLAWTVLSEGRLLLDLHPQLRMQQETRIMSRWELDYLHQRKRHG